MSDRCAACEAAERAALGYLLTLHDRPVQSLVLQVTESRGFCDVHTRWLLRTAPSPQMPLLIYWYVISSVLRSRNRHWPLRRAPCAACAAGEHAARRRIEQGALANRADRSCALHAPDAGTSESVYVDGDAQIRAQLRRMQAGAVGACSACTARADAEQCVVASSARSGGVARLCGHHLADLALIDTSGPDRRLRRRVSGADCAACRAGRQAETPPLSGHAQLCLADRERIEGHSTKRRAAMNLRLEVLLWELTELRRKLAWNGRGEAVGVERDVWLRAPLALDGKVALGRGTAALARALGCESLAHPAGSIPQGDGARLEPPK